MSFDGITFRELVQYVPWRCITEVPGFWKEVCSSLAEIAKSVLAQEREGATAQAHLCMHRTGRVSALLWSNPRAFIKNVRWFPWSEC